MSDFRRPRDILSYFGVNDAASVDFDELWGTRRDINSPETLRIPFGVRADNGELVFVDIKDMNQGGDGPHGVMSGTTVPVRLRRFALCCSRRSWGILRRTCR